MDLSPRQQSEMEQFLAEKTEWLDSRAADVILRVLVWGPSADCPLKDKMDEIIEEIGRADHLPILSADVNTEAFSVSFEEFADAVKSDLIIILAGSYGPVAELHQFALASELARKMIVFLPDEARGGFTDESITRQLREIECSEYSQQDLAACSVKSHAMDIIKQKRDSEAVRLAMIEYMSERRNMQ